MDLPWGDEKSIQFITNVGLITTDGPAGPNIMAAEWTHHVSYEPGIIAVCIHKSNKATAVNIKKTKEFGVNLAATDQSVMASIAGSQSGIQYDKIKALEELEFKFYKAKKIDVPMVEGAALNLECKLVKTSDIGSHTIFFGEAVEATVSGKEPLAYHKGKYWKMADNIENPVQEERDRIRKIIEKYRKS